MPPDGLREVLEQRLESIHAGIEGIDTLASEHVAAVDLDLTELARSSAPERDAKRRPSYWPALILVALAISALGWYGLREWRWQSRVDALRGILAAHPGFVLTGLDARGGVLAIRGLIDADADPIASRLAEAEIVGIEPAYTLSGYVSTDDAIVVRRTRRLLDAPSSVTVEAHSGQLRLGGSAPAAWIAGARERAGWVPGVREVVFGTADEIDPVAVARAGLVDLAERLAGLRVRFVRDAESLPGNEATVAAIIIGLHEAIELADRAGVGIRVDVIGCNDAPGSDEINADMRRSRALWLRDALLAGGVPSELLRPIDAQVEPVGANMKFRGAMVRLSTEPEVR